MITPCFFFIIVPSRDRTARLGGPLVFFTPSFVLVALGDVGREVTGLFCLRFAPLAVSNFFDHLWLFFVNRSEFGSCVRVAFKSSSSFAWTASVSRRSARWMNSVIVQTIKVAMACQSNVEGSNMKQRHSIKQHYQKGCWMTGKATDGRCPMSQ